jgi:hypothetical protein
MCAALGACVRRRSLAGYTINMFEFEFPTGTVCDHIVKTKPQLKLLRDLLRAAAKRSL